MTDARRGSLLYQVGQSWWVTWQYLDLCTRWSRQQNRKAVRTPESQTLNWDAVGAVGQIIGAGAVVVSLVYLAVQIRQSNQLARRSATAASVAAFREWSAILLSRPDLVRIYGVGMTGTANLASDEERSTFIALASTFFKAMEDIHYQFVTGALDEDVWSGWAWIAQNHMTAPGMQDYWSTTRLGASRAFREWVESLPPTEHLASDRVAALRKLPD